MGTVFWLPSSGSAAVTVTPSATDWDGHVNSIRRPMPLTRSNTALTTLAYAPDAADHLVDVNTMIAQFVSDILPPQPMVAQQVTFGARTLESNALNNLYESWKLYAVNAAGDTILGTMVAIFKSATSEISTSLTGYCETRLSTLVTCYEPWRLVLEAGADGLPTTGGGRHNFSYVFGDPMATGAQNLPQSDDTTACIPMLLLSNDLVTSFKRRAMSLIGF